MNSSVTLAPALLSRIPVFESLDSDELEDIVNAPDNAVEKYTHREVVVGEGEDADCMYILLQGRLEVIVRNNSAPSSVREVVLAKLRAGDFFGEQALLPGSTGKRNASVRVLYKARVFRIAKKHVLHALRDSEEQKSGATPDIQEIKGEEFSINNIRTTIMTIPFFKNLTNHELERLEYWSETVTFSAGDVIIKKFQKNKYLYVIHKGSVEVFNVDEKGNVIVLANLDCGRLFGEQALLPGSSGKSNAFVKAKEESIMARIPKRYFLAMHNRNVKIGAKLQQTHKDLLKKRRILK